jgi:hypothetical protein
MSIGNLKDQGNKGNNLPYQLKTLQLLGAINDSISALPGVDHESRTSTYQAINNGTGYSIGDIIIRYDIIDLATGLIDSTIWFNDTLQTQITPAPLPGDLTPVSAPTGVTVLNGPAGAAVNIQDGGNSITVDGTFWQATQPVSGPLTDAELRATPVPVSGTFYQSIQPVNQVERTGTSGYTGAITGVAATDVIAAPGVGLFTYVTQILVTNSHATVGTLVTIQTEDGTGLYAGYAAPTGGGFSVTFTVPIKMPVANKKLQAICGTTGANVYVSASGYIAA